MNSLTQQDQYSRAGQMRSSSNRPETKGYLDQFTQAAMAQANQDDKSYEGHNRQPTGTFIERYCQREETAQTPSLEVEITNQKEDKGGYTEFFSWGNDDRGQLGHGIDQQNVRRSLNIPKSLSFEVIIKQISCGSQHSGFISQEGHVFTFGNNSDGQLGIDDRCVHVSTAPLLVSTLLQKNVYPKALSCGGDHTGIISLTGDVYMWGRNQQGQCGRSMIQEGSIFAPSLTDNTIAGPAAQLDCGSQHTAVLSQNGNVYTFGDNSQGQLGLGNGMYRTQLAVDRPTRVEELKYGIKQISAGQLHTLVLTNQGQIYGMGSNRRQEMGLGESHNASITNFYSPIKLEQLEIHNITSVAAGGFSAAITDLKQMIVWGTGAFGVFSTPQKVCMDGVYFTQIAISKFDNPSAAALDDKGHIYSWGPNHDGQLGQGDFTQRILPTQILQLKRKQINQVALGEKYAIALGKNVSLATLRKKKEAKARRRREQELKRNHEHQLRDQGHSSVSPLRLDSNQRRSGNNPNNPIGQHNEIKTNFDAKAHSLPRETIISPTANNRTQVSEMSSGHMLSPADSCNLRHKRPDFSGHNSSKAAQIPPQTLSHFQKKQTNLSAIAETRINESQVVEDNKSPARSVPGYIEERSQLNLTNQNSWHPGPNDRSMLSQGSPLRNKSPQIAKQEHQARSLVPPASSCRPTGISVDRAQGANMQRADSLNRYGCSRRQLDTQETISHTHQNQVVHAFNEPSRGRTIETKDENKSPIHRAFEDAKPLQSHRSALQDTLHERQASHLEGMLKQQLEEKEQRIRQQQDIIQELRNHLNNDQVSANQKYDQLNERFRNIERERNDLRTRIAQDLRSFQTQTDQLNEQIRKLDQERESDRVAYESRFRRLQQDAKEREEQLQVQHARQKSDLLSQEGEKRKVEVMTVEEKRQQDVQHKEREVQDLRQDITNLSNTVKNQREEYERMDNDKQLMTEELASRGVQLRDLEERNQQLNETIQNYQRECNHLKEELNLTISRKDQQYNNLNDQFQSTTAKMNVEIHDLQKRIESQDYALSDMKLKEEDQQRQIAIEMDKIRQRDMRIEQMQHEIGAGRKQVEDLKNSVVEVESLRGELSQRFDDLRFDCQKNEEQLRNANQIIQNQEGEIQQFKVQIDRERTKSDKLQLELDDHSTQNQNLRRELADEQRRTQLREQDIQGLEVALNDLKDNMGQEYAQKSRDFENVTRAYDDQRAQYDKLQGLIMEKNNELENGNKAQIELQAHSQALLDKLNYMEGVIADLEDKNKKLTDLLNSHLYDRAQSYKETVLDRLMQKRTNAEAVPQPARSATPDPTIGRKMDIASSMEPEAVSAQRLRQILNQHQAQTDTLNTHYMALQQQLNQQKHGKSPIRSHEIELAAVDPSNKLNSEGYNNHYWALSRSIDKANPHSPKGRKFNEELMNSQQFRSKVPDPRQVHPEENTLIRGSVASTYVQQVPHHLESYHDSANDVSPSRSQAAAASRSPIQSTTFRPNNPILQQPAFSTGGLQLSTTEQPARQYSPLRSKTPTATAKLQAKEDEAQKQNSTISASNINARVMANELRNLRQQIADMQRNKEDLEGRLNQYEASH